MTAFPETEAMQVLPKSCIGLELRMQKMGAVKDWCFVVIHIQVLFCVDGNFKN